jgi:hypothetical protein
MKKAVSEHYKYSPIFFNFQPGAKCKLELHLQEVVYHSATKNSHVRCFALCKEHLNPPTTTAEEIHENGSLLTLCCTVLKLKFSWILLNLKM